MIHSAFLRKHTPTPTEVDAPGEHTFIAAGASEPSVSWPTKVSFKDLRAVEARHPSWRRCPCTQVLGAHTSDRRPSSIKMPISPTESTPVVPNLFAKLRLRVSARQPQREAPPHSAGVLLPDGLRPSSCVLLGRAATQLLFLIMWPRPPRPLRLSSWWRQSCGRPLRIWAPLIPPSRASHCEFRTSSPSVPSRSSEDSAAQQQRSHSTLRRESCSDPRLICRPGTLVGKVKLLVLPRLLLAKLQTWHVRLEFFFPSCTTQTRRHRNRPSDDFLSESIFACMTFFRQKRVRLLRCVRSASSTERRGRAVETFAALLSQLLKGLCPRLAVGWHRHWRLGRRPSQSWQASAGIAPSRQARHRTPRCSSACVGHLSPRQNDQLGWTRSPPLPLLSASDRPNWHFPLFSPAV